MMVIEHWFNVFLPGGRGLTLPEMNMLDLKGGSKSNGRELSGRACDSSVMMSETLTAI